LVGVAGKLNENSLKYFSTAISEVISNAMNEGIICPQEELSALAKLLMNRFDLIITNRGYTSPPEVSIANALESICFGNGLNLDMLFLVWSHTMEVLTAYSELLSVCLILLLD
jgi:hypothetical protein